MSVKIMETFRVVKCRIIYQFGMSELLLRSNEIVNMSALYTHNILIVKTKTQIRVTYIARIQPNLYMYNPDV
jgi:hypothetical protein